jgi:hypothetical protein
MRALLLLSATLLALGASAHPAVSVVADSRGNLYYSDLAAVWRVAPDGTRSVMVRDVHTHELYIDAADNLYGEDAKYEGGERWSFLVWKRAPNGQVTRVIPRRDGFRTDYSFVRDRAGNMYFASGKEIRRRDPAGRITTIARGLEDVRWMHARPDGTLFVHAVPDIVRIAPGGRMTTVLRNVAAQRHEVMGLFSDAAGNLYFADYHHRELKRIAADGRVTVAARSTAPWGPTGGIVTKSGELWVLEANLTEHRLRRVGK